MSSTRTSYMRPLAALVALVAAMGALLIAYNASPARAADGTCNTTGTITSCTFAFTGTEQTFQVPDGVSSVQVLAIGAPGALGINSSAGVAGRGAQVSGDLAVTPLQTLYVEVGGAPTGSGTSDCVGDVACIGGFNGGGSNRFGGGGGGATDVRTVSRSGDPLASLESRLIVAAGGGGSGAGWTCFDDHGNPIISYPGGSGGDAGLDGGDGASCGTLAGGTGGKAGTQSAGGLGGSPRGQSGSLGQGGSGGGNTGGGGGGGYYGGGGGGQIVVAPSDGAPAGGGGGGSSLVPTGGSGPTIATGVPPSVTITYTTPPPPDTTAPSVSCSVSPSTLRLPANNHKLVTINATVDVTDGGSGADGFTLVSVTSNQRDSGLARDDVAGDIKGWITGTNDTTGQVRAERYGQDRVYTLNYEGYDKAGNKATCSATVTVPKKGG